VTTARKIPVRLISLLLFIFFFSGFSSLIYQIVWQRVLSLYYGVGAISITLIISVYMFGLGIGALFGGLLAEKIKNKMTLYFAVELLIGCFGLISLPLLGFLGRHTAGSSYLISAVYMLAFLSLPTLLMGITLPLLTKIFNPLIHNFLRTVSLLYFINTIGAAIGTVFSSYVLISLFGLDIAVYFAVVVNFILAALIFLARYLPTGRKEKQYLPQSQDGRDVILGRMAYLLVFITGFLAIGYEIVWLRVVGVLVKASPYAFSSVLSVYLFGIAIGSFGMGRYLRREKAISRRNLFFLLQFLIGTCVMVTFAGYYYLTKYTALGLFTQLSFSFPVHPPLVIPSVPTRYWLGGILYYLYCFYCLADVFFWPMIFVFVPTILMGASFPLISSLALSQINREGKTVGTVYFFNIAGNVLGGVLTGFVLLACLGTETTLLIFSSVGIFLGLFVTRFAARGLPGIAKLALVIVLLTANAAFFPKKGRLYEIIHASPGKDYDVYLQEGVDGIIVTYQHQEKVKNYINGLGHGGRPSPWFNYETIKAASFAQKAKNVLVIGFGEQLPK